MRKQAAIEASKALYRWSRRMPAAATLTPIVHRVQGRSYVVAEPFDELCFFGEDVAVAWMRQALGEDDAERLGGVLPIDVLSSRHAVEVKAGLLTNSANAQHWRLTFSAARGPEAAKLEAMSDAERRQYRAAKQDRIEARKLALLDALREQSGWPLAPATLTMIVDQARRDVDVFWFEGWHRRIGWNSREAREAYRGSFAVDWRGRS